jgi:hypothetical protein
MSTFIQYMHNGVLVWAELTTIGEYKNHNMCLMCTKLASDCSINQSILELQNKHKIQLPVWECPEFNKRKWIPN